VPLSRIFFNVQRVAVDIAKLPELARNLARNSNFAGRFNLMEYRGIRYTLRAGIERGQWSVVIYPQGVETSGVKVLGTRDDAELHARRMIKRWLQSQQGEKEP